MDRRLKPGNDPDRALDRDLEREPSLYQRPRIPLDPSGAVRTATFGALRVPGRGRPNARLVDICAGVYDDGVES